VIFCPATTHQPAEALKRRTSGQKTASQLSTHPEMRYW